MRTIEPGKVQRWLAVPCSAVYWLAARIDPEGYDDGVTRRAINSDDGEVNLLEQCDKVQAEV
jgi:hypothetical protein